MTIRAVYIDPFRERSERWRWKVYTEAVDVEASGTECIDERTETGTLDDLLRAIDRLPAVEPSMLPLGDSADGDGYSPWLSSESETDYRTGETVCYSLHVERIRRDGTAVRIGGRNLRRILRCAGVLRP